MSCWSGYLINYIVTVKFTCSIGIILLIMNMYVHTVHVGEFESLLANNVKLMIRKKSGKLEPSNMV